MRVTQIVRAGFLLLMVASFNAAAIPIYQLDAATMDPALVTSFTIIYADTDDDMDIVTGEVSHFSGITCLALCSPSGFYGEIASVPNIPGIIPGTADTWGFDSPTLSGIAVDTALFTYTRSQIGDTENAPVPEPPIALLLASGLIAFGVVRRKHKA